MEENIEGKGIKQHSSAEISLSHDLECSHLLRSVSDSHSSATHCSSTPTPLPLPSLTSVTGSFCHSSSHLVNHCNTFKSLQCISRKTSAQSKAASWVCLHQPGANSRAAEHMGDLATREPWAWAAGTVGILIYVCAYTVIQAYQQPCSGHHFPSFIFDLLYHKGLSSEKYLDTCCSALAKPDQCQTGLRAKVFKEKLART